MYDLIETLENPDCHLAIESIYLDLLVSALLDRPERLHRAQPPAAYQEALLVRKDLRVFAPCEPFDALHDAMNAGLQPYVGAEVLDWPAQGGIPVCRKEDGGLVIIICHLFSGRRRHGDCRYILD